MKNVPITYGESVKTEETINQVERSILSCLCYFDVFNYPLKIKEIHSFLPETVLTLKNLEHTIQSHPLTTLIHHTDGYYFLFYRDPDIISRRIQAEHLAQRQWVPARRMTKIIKLFPFVRAVMISGDLSKNVATEASDIDYFILTEPGRLWIVRLLLTIFKKTVLLNDKKYYCLNFFRSTNYLNFEFSQDYFTATELVTLKSLYNNSLFSRLLDNNNWVYSFFPNYRSNGSEQNHAPDTASRVQILLEKLLSIFPLDGVDTWIMNYMQRTWHRRYPHLSGDEIAYRFRCTKDESTAFAVESRRDIMAAYTARMKRMEQLLINEYESVKT
jgi:hypothetical protein